MNRRIVIRLILLAGVLAFWFLYRPRDAGPRVMPPEVPIVDGKTLDFSKGKAEIRDTAADQAALEAGLKEMEEATKDVTFGPSPAPPPP